MSKAAVIRRNTESRTNWRFPRRKQRREEAVERQEYYDGLSLVEKIAAAVSRRGNSEKELGRLREQQSEA